MNDESAKVHTFHDSPEERRSDTDRAKERRTVSEQLERWRRIGSNPTFRRGAIEILQDRRRGRRDLTQLEPVDLARSDTLVVSGRFLITADAFAKLDDDSRRSLAEFDLVASTVPGLGGKIIQLDEADPATPRLSGRTAETALRFRRAGVDLRPTYMVPLGMIRKAEGGPENSAWVQQKPAEDALKLSTSASHAALSPAAARWTAAATSLGSTHPAHGSIRPRVSRNDDRSPES